MVSETGVRNDDSESVSEVRERLSARWRHPNDFAMRYTISSAQAPVAVTGELITGELRAARRPAARLHVTLSIFIGGVQTKDAYASALPHNSASRLAGCMEALLARRQGL